MKITFIGTRGGIIPRSKKHYMHSTILIKTDTNIIMIDCGSNWTNYLQKLKPNAIFLTHAHPDHAEGLKYGAPCKVYATQETWLILKRYPIETKITVIPRKKIKLGALTIEAFEVEHSIIAPAVGYKIYYNGKIIFYVPDLVKIKEESAALKNVDIYIGDGATLKGKHLIRTRGNQQIGHSPVITQIQWCVENKIKKIIITHCGSQITKGNPAKINKIIKEFSEEYNVLIEIAYDGMILNLS